MLGMLLMGQPHYDDSLTSWTTHLFRDDAEPLSDDEQSGDEDLPDAAYSQNEFTQETRACRSPSPVAAYPQCPVDFYLYQGAPAITVFIMNQDDAIAFYQACKRQGHKAVVKFISGGQAVVKYSSKLKAYKEVGSYTSIRVISNTERRLSNVANSVRRCSLSTLSHPSGRWCWVLLVMAGLFSVCVTVLSMCLGFGECFHCYPIS